MDRPSDHLDLSCLRVAELPIAACTLDEHLRFTEINEALAEINGPSVEEHLGCVVYDVVPEMADTIRPLMERALAGERFSCEVSGATPRSPGELRHWRANYSPIVRDGRVCGVAIVATEITGEVRAKKERQRASRRVRRQNDTLKMLTNAMAHDLKSPIATAVMRLEYALQSVPDDDATAEHVRDAISTLRDGSNMISGLLRIANIGSIGSVDIVPLEPLCRSVWRRIEALVRDAGPAKLEILGMLPDAMGDVDLVSEALQNLFENAIKHRLPGCTCVVSVSASVERDRLRIHVDDNGPGIEASQRERLFTPFSKGTGSNGTGLGLAVVERVISAHRGEIVVSESPTGGARFSFDLPCYADTIGEPLADRSDDPTDADHPRTHATSA